MRRLALAAALAALLAGCGGTASTPPSATTLLAKIPACHGYVAQTPSVLAVSDGSCHPPATGSALGVIEVVTFATMGSEQKWITQQAAHPDGTEGCCVEGHLWAADYQFSVTSEFPRIIRALGGRPVTG